MRPKLALIYAVVMTTLAVALAVGLALYLEQV